MTFDITSAASYIKCHYIDSIVTNKCNEYKVFWLYWIKSKIENML